MDFKEILVYIVVGCSSLFLSAYTVHMVVGGVVEEKTEYSLMGVMCLLVATAIGYMAWDVYKKRRNKR
jgi:uncharacterized protein related to proFAR isomerase